MSPAYWLYFYIIFYAIAFSKLFLLSGTARVRNIFSAARLKHIEAAVTAMIVLARSLCKSKLECREHQRGQRHSRGFVSQLVSVLSAVADPICLQELSVAWSIVSTVHKSPKERLHAWLFSRVFSLVLKRENGYVLV